MPQQILQINFTFNVSPKEYENIVAPLANQFADVPGCLWKIWLMDEKRYQAGGIYLFDSEDSAEHFRFSDLAEQMMHHPSLSNFSIKQFGILDKPSLLTRAPLSTAAVVGNETVL